MSMGGEGVRIPSLCLDIVSLLTYLGIWYLNAFCVTRMCQFSQLLDLCPRGMSMGGDGVRIASLLISMEPTITIGFAEVAWEKRELSKLIFRKRPGYGRGGLVDLSGSAQLHSLAG